MCSAPNQTVLVLRRNLARALRAGELGEAGSILARLKRDDPLAVETRGSELELLLRSSRLDEAQKLSKQLVQLFPSSARVVFLAGQVAARHRDHDRARALFEESLRLAPHWRIRRWLGRTLTHLGNFEEAEPVLLSARDENPSACRDLAWLYERRDLPERAVEELETYLKHFPRDQFAATQLERLRAHQLDEQGLIDEVETLAELGEDVSPEVLAVYIERLVDRGELGRVRGLIADQLSTFTDPVLTRIAWTCHRAHVPDLAYELFVHTFDRNCTSVKFLNALEFDALRAGRAEALIELYRGRAGDDPRYWGRARKLERRSRNPELSDSAG